VSSVLPASRFARRREAAPHDVRRSGALPEVLPFSPASSPFQTSYRLLLIRQGGLLFCARQQRAWLHESKINNHLKSKLVQ